MNNEWIGKNIEKKIRSRNRKNSKNQSEIAACEQKIISRQLELRALVPEDELELLKASQKYTRLDPSSTDQLCHSAYFQRTLFHQFKRID